MTTRRRGAGRPPSLTRSQGAHVRAAIKRLLRQHRTYAALGRMFRISGGSVKAIVEGGGPSAETARRVAAACGVDVAELLDGRAR